MCDVTSNMFRTRHIKATCGEHYRSLATRDVRGNQRTLDQCDTSGKLADFQEYGRVSLYGIANVTAQWLSTGKEVIG
jgi:predicted NUDIX family NTP pyrophosphohydrolase